MNHVILQRCLVDDLCRALHVTADQLQGLNGDGVISRQIVEDAHQALATVKARLDDDQAGDRLRAALSDLEHAGDADLEAIALSEALELAETAAKWAHKAESRLCKHQAPSKHVILVHRPDHDQRAGLIFRAEVRSPGTWSAVSPEHRIVAGKYTSQADPIATIVGYIQRWRLEFPEAVLDCRAKEISKAL